MENKDIEQSLEALTGEVSNAIEAVNKSKEAVETQFKDLTNHYAGKAETAELKAAVEKHSSDYADLVAKHQANEAVLDMVKKQLDAPIMQGGEALKEADYKAAIELQRRAFEFKGGIPDEFKLDKDNLVDMDSYRSVAKKLMQVGIESKSKVIRSFDEAETKAFEIGSVDTAIFSPEMLGYELDCNTECAYMLDLYGQESVSRSTFMYPHVEDYGAIGQYGCDAKCDAEFGPEGNITYKQGKTFDFRGVFCFQRKVLAEANYDLLGFMVRSAQRSHRINRNQALITGDGVNMPKGWLTADCFAKKTSSAGTITPQDARTFITSAPLEYGPVSAVMHQNVFAFLAASVDNNGRFIFGDGQMTYSPDDANERIRISNCLPDATEDFTKGDAANPFVAGEFLMAVANWSEAYKNVSKTPMFMEQHVGNSSAWCVQYQFGAEDGGFVGCCDAGRILVAGA